MSFTSRLRNLRGVLAPRRMDRKHWRRPRLEILEDRCTPALYAITDLGVLGGGYSYAFDLNESGQVVGQATTSEGAHAFLWDHDTMIDLGTLGGSSSYALGINDLGQVVGAASLPADTGYHAFLVNPEGGMWFRDSDLDGRNDLMIDLGTLPGSGYSDAADINNAGKVVGSSGGHAFHWDAANGMIALDTALRLTNSYASDINESGQVTGVAGYDAFLWDAANGMVFLSVSDGYTVSAATALNDAGQVAGYHGDFSTMIAPAFLWTPSSPHGLTGNFTDLGTLPDDTDSTAAAINNAGQVVGTSRSPFDFEIDYYHYHAFLWDPVGGMVNLQDQLLPGSNVTLENAQAINDSGAIAVNGYGRAYLLTPVQPSIRISEALTVTEGNSGTAEATFTVTLSKVSDQIVTVDFATAAGTAAAGTDFVPAAGTLTFLPGDISKPITVQVNGDLLDEDPESFTVNLSNPISAFIFPGRGTGTILDDDPMPTLAVNDVRVAERNSGATSAVFTVSLSAPSSRFISVYYETTDGTAAAGSDYQDQFGWLYFYPGQVRRIVNIVVNGDTLNEADETFTVNLSTPTNATLADPQGVGTILNDNGFTLAIGDEAVNEGHSGTTILVFTVSLSAASSQAVTVNYATANGTSTAGSDYQSATGTLTIPAGQTSGTISVVVCGDRLGEPNESFVVNLSTPTNATITDARGVGTIVDDEPRISINDVAKKEGKKGQTTLFTFTVTLSAAYDQAVTMSFRTVDGTAKSSDSDYVAKTGTLTFAPGETTKTITIEVKGESKSEANETFWLELFGASGNALFLDWLGLGTILNDD